MARAQFNVPTRFLDAFEATAARLDANGTDALKAGDAVAEPRLRANLTGAIGRSRLLSRSTGQSLAALGTTSAKVNGPGRHNIKVGFAESSTDGRSNGMIANIIEHGCSNQAARPFLVPARSQASRAAMDAN